MRCMNLMNKPMWYVLNHCGEVVPSPDGYPPMPDFHCGFDLKTQVEDDACVSTDHRFGSGPPLVFETMIFGGEYDECQWRYSTKLEAEQGHARVVEALQTGQTPHLGDDDADY